MRGGRTGCRCGVSQASRRSHQPPAVSGLVLSVTQSAYQGLPKTRTSISAASVPAPGADLYRLVRAMNPSIPNGFRSPNAPALISVAIALTGDSRAMVPAILLVLVLGMILLLRVRDPRADERLGGR